MSKTQVSSLALVGLIGFTMQKLAENSGTQSGKSLARIQERYAGAATAIQLLLTTDPNQLERACPTIHDIVDTNTVLPLSTQSDYDKLARVIENGAKKLGIASHTLAGKQIETAIVLIKKVSVHATTPFQRDSTGIGDMPRTQQTERLDLGSRVQGHIGRETHGGAPADTALGVGATAAPSD